MAAIVDPLSERDEPAASSRREDQLSAAIRDACIAEATSPKCGNVHPGASFDDLRYEHFIAAAYIAAETLTAFDVPLSRRIADCVRRTRDACGTNVNLGIALMIGPLVEAARRCPSKPREAVADVLGSFTPADGGVIAAAIASAAAGGLGDAPEHDVRQVGDVDILAAMRAAVDRDDVARQWATGYADLIDVVVPMLDDEVEVAHDIGDAVRDAALRILADRVDTLIARKNGRHIAEEVRRRAKGLDRRDPVAVADFDRYLRSNGNRLNPGTTADLIAAALFWRYVRPV